MANFQHFDMATLGVRAGHKVMALSGVGFVLQIIVKFTGGGGGGSWVDRRVKEREVKSLFSLIKIKFNEKEENFLFYSTIQLQGVDIDVKLIKVDKPKDGTMVKALLNKVMKIAQKPIIKIKEML